MHKCAMQEGETRDFTEKVVQVETQFHRLLREAESWPQAALQL